MAVHSFSKNQKCEATENNQFHRIKTDWVALNAANTCDYKKAELNKGRDEEFRITWKFTWAKIFWFQLCKVFGKIRLFMLNFWCWSFAYSCFVCFTFIGNFCTRYINSLNRSILWKHEEKQLHALRQTLNLKWFFLFYNHAQFHMLCVFYMCC